MCVFPLPFFVFCFVGKLLVNNPCFLSIMQSVHGTPLALRWVAVFSEAQQIPFTFYLSRLTTTPSRFFVSPLSPRPSCKHFVVSYLRKKVIVFASARAGKT